MRERSDGELVAEARQGSAEAFGMLVKRYMRPGYLVALSVTGSAEDAEDVAQEAFVVALERLEDCRDPDRFGGWFLTIVRNRARNYLRRERLRRGEEVDPETSKRSTDPEVTLEAWEIRRHLLAAMDGLSAVRREILLLHDLEGWKHREIGERLGLPDGTVRSHLHFARKFVRERLESILKSGPTGEEP